MATKPTIPNPLDVNLDPKLGLHHDPDEDEGPEPNVKAPPAGQGAAPPFATSTGRPVTPSAGAGGAYARVPSGGSPNDMIDDRSRPPPRLPPQVERSPMKFRK